MWSKRRDAPVGTILGLRRHAQSPTKAVPPADVPRRSDRSRHCAARLRREIGKRGARRRSFERSRRLAHRLVSRPARSCLLPGLRTCPMPIASRFPASPARGCRAARAIGRDHVPGLRQLRYKPNAPPHAVPPSAITLRRVRYRQLQSDDARGVPADVGRDLQIPVSEPSRCGHAAAAAGDAAACRRPHPAPAHA